MGSQLIRVIVATASVRPAVELQWGVMPSQMVAFSLGCVLVWALTGSWEELVHCKKKMKISHAGSITRRMMLTLR